MCPYNEVLCSYIKRMKNISICCFEMSSRVDHDIKKFKEKTMYYAYCLSKEVIFLWLVLEKWKSNTKLKGVSVIYRAGFFNSSSIKSLDCIIPCCRTISCIIGWLTPYLTSTYKCAYLVVTTRHCQMFLGDNILRITMNVEGTE